MGTGCSGLGRGGRFCRGVAVSDRFEGWLRPVLAARDRFEGWLRPVPTGRLVQGGGCDGTIRPSSASGFACCCPAVGACDGLHARSGGVDGAHQVVGVGVCAGLRPRSGSGGYVGQGPPFSGLGRSGMSGPVGVAGAVLGLPLVCGEVGSPTPRVGANLRALHSLRETRGGSFCGRGRIG